MNIRNLNLVEVDRDKSPAEVLRERLEWWQLVSGLLFVTVLALIFLGASPVCAAEAATTVVSRYDGAVRGRHEYYEYHMRIAVKHDVVTAKKKKELINVLEGLLAEACEDGSCDSASIPFLREDAKKAAKEIGIRVRGVKVNYQEFHPRPNWKEKVREAKKRLATARGKIREALARK